MKEKNGKRTSVRGYRRLRSPRTLEKNLSESKEEVSILEAESSSSFRNSIAFPRCVCVLSTVSETDERKNYSNHEAEKSLGRE